MDFHALRLLFLLLLALPAQAAYLCVPKEIGGTGTYYRLTTTASASALQWVCASPAGPIVQGPVWRKDFLPTAGCVASLSMSDPIPMANQAAAACDTAGSLANGHYADPVLDGAFQAGLVSIRTAWAADHPASGPVYKVPPTGSSVYPIVNGKLGIPISGRRATGNSLCDCTSKITAGAYTYCTFSGGAPTEAALCLTP